MMRLYACYRQHFDPEVLQHDLTFVRRVQALAAKTREQHDHHHKNEQNEEEAEEHEQSETEGPEQSEMEGPEQAVKSANPAEEEEEEENSREEPLDAVADAMTVE